MALRGFMCMWLFGLCEEGEGGGEGGGEEVSVTLEECEEVSVMLCPQEWEVAKQSGVALPECSELPRGDGATCVGECAEW